MVLPPWPYRNLDRAKCNPPQLRMQLLATGGYVSSAPVSLPHSDAERWSLCAPPDLIA